MLPLPKERFSDSQHSQHALQSLSLRCHSEVRLCVDVLPDGTGKATKKRLCAYERDLRPSLGLGKGPRLRSKHVDVASLAAQLGRTGDRLSLELALHNDFLAVRRALRALGLR